MKKVYSGNMRDVYHVSNRREAMAINKKLNMGWDLEGDYDDPPAPLDNYQGGYNDTMYVIIPQSGAKKRDGKKKAHPLLCFISYDGESTVYDALNYAHEGFPFDLPQEIFRYIPISAGEHESWDGHAVFSVDERGELHNDNGMAVQNKDGGFGKYYRHGKIHREDGPARIIMGDSVWWYNNGEGHREDGPAWVHIEYGDVVRGGYKLHGKNATKEDLMEKMGWDGIDRFDYSPYLKAPKRIYEGIRTRFNLLRTAKIGSTIT